MLKFIVSSLVAVVFMSVVGLGYCRFVLGSWLRERAGLFYGEDAVYQSAVLGDGGEFDGVACAPVAGARADEFYTDTRYVSASLLFVSDAFWTMVAGWTTCLVMFLGFFNPRPQHRVPVAIAVLTIGALAAWHVSLYIKIDRTRSTDGNFDSAEANSQQAILYGSLLVVQVLVFGGLAKAVGAERQCALTVKYMLLVVGNIVVEGFL
jgi:hypothetical protein